MDLLDCVSGGIGYVDGIVTEQFDNECGFTV
jgi:hypothetical protein